MSQPQRDVSPPHVPPSHRAVITVTISGDILHSLDCTDLFITISSSLVSTSITVWHPVLPPHNVGPKLYLVIDTKWCWSTKTPTWLRSCDVGRSGLLVFICIIKSGEYRAHAHSIIMLEGWESRKCVNFFNLLWHELRRIYGNTTRQLCVNPANKPIFIRGWREALLGWS